MDARRIGTEFQRNQAQEFMATFFREPEVSFSQARGAAACRDLSAQALSAFGQLLAQTRTLPGIQGTVPMPGYQSLDAIEAARHHVHA
ncbi:MAG: hypothetical protein WCH98_22430, partial [Verrucomicrobiota bacterium]